jgi:hypothetical protein
MLGELLEETLAEMLGCLALARGVTEKGAHKPPQQKRISQARRCRLTR